jgi:hypothetical protein
MRSVADVERSENMPELEWQRYRLISTATQINVLTSLHGRPSCRMLKFDGPLAGATTNFHKFLDVGQRLNVLK